MNINKLIREIAKNQRGWRNNLPVVKIPGKSPPKVCGTGFYYTNKTGDHIRWPSAYMNAWGKPIYHRSTLRIEVGEKYKE